MYIVNTSFMVAASVQTQWLKLMQENYIPFLREKGLTRLHFTRVLNTDASDQSTFSLQVHVDDIPHYQLLTGELFSEYETIARNLFGDRVLYFTSLLKKIEI